MLNAVDASDLLVAPMMVNLHLTVGIVGSLHTSPYHILNSFVHRICVIGGISHWGNIHVVGGKGY